jgi:phosphoenolpyruvate carboxykinase (diphosphate)
LEKLEDFEHGGKMIMASRLGYRINSRFVHAFFARVFNHPHAVFTPEMLKPELQDLDVYVDGINNIVETQKRIAQMYFDDGSIARACPPLKALLHIMRDGQWEGKGLQHPEVRNLFTREALLASDWYAARLQAKQSVDRRLWRRHVEYLEKFLKRGSHADQAVRLGLPDRLVSARKHSEKVESPDYLKGLVGTIGAEPIQSFF